MNSGDPLGSDNHLSGLKNSLLTVDEFILNLFELVAVTFFFGLFVTRGGGGGGGIVVYCAF